MVLKLVWLCCCCCYCYCCCCCCAQCVGQSASQDDADIAFFIQISNQTVAHLPRLLARIHHPQNMYGVHIDSKVAAHVRAQVMHDLFAANAHYKHNVFFMRSEAVTYRGISMVLNTLDAMHQLLRRHGHWHYLINLSGADYPLVDSVTIRRLLGAYKQQQLNFLTLSERSSWQRNKRWRLRAIHIDPALSFARAPNASLLTLAQRNPLSDWLQLQYTSGEAWMIASRQMCEVATRSGFARKLLLAFAVSADASEHFFATLATNHAALRRRVVPHALRQVFWTLNGSRAGQHPFYVDDDASLRARVRASRNLFARKFRHAHSPLMAAADAQHCNRTHVRAVAERLRWVVAQRRGAL